MRRGLWAAFSLLVLNGCQHLATDTATSTAGIVAGITTPAPSSEPVADVAATPSPATADDAVVELPSTDITPVPVTDLWERIRFGLQFETVENDDVLAQRAWFERNQEYMDRVSQRAGRYMHYIVEQIDARGLPMDLALLPIVESAFHPYAYSRSRASGIWQFMPKTGKGFGMEQNWWQDGRRDVLRSTDAALDYLTRLNKMFGGDWLLALAAYNAGEGNIMRAVEKNRRAGKPTDFWSLKLRQETSAYVPKMLALGQLLREQDRFALRFQPIPNEPYFARIKVDSQIDLALAAELSGTPEDELYQLNPQFNRWATDPKGPHELLVPIANAERFAEALRNTPVDERVKWASYTVKAGDNVGKIAKQFRTSADLLRSTNKLKGNNIRVGQQLLIPKAGSKTEAPGTVLANLNPRQKAELNRVAAHAERATEYQVQQGDTLWSISRRHQMSLNDLLALNELTAKSSLRVGQVLKVSGSRASSNVVSNNVGSSKVASVEDSTASNPNLGNRKVRYTVRSGDSLARIAQQFGVKIADLGRWNNWPHDRVLKPGQKLTVYIDQSEAFGG
ncbi:LysM peptidoglycan-binding domain-containing protein [Permianibacter sp. IMCC34836]|uniref:lytic transglycosylase n=1 Tax=Permianibacter fluminis TaxID=2738515 RepID=UPI0015579663|nr:LysM peptidoglycan-binding domain-containing protein [Permianibacter fluminis]NQD38740.1 LysM peptidoglycan-binding domain-containing protein [Permianibacter fluminis]